jgi:hypothetical protein
VAIGDIPNQLFFVTDGPASNCNVVECIALVIVVCKVYLPKFSNYYIEFFRVNFVSYESRLYCINADRQEFNPLVCHSKALAANRAEPTCKRV